MSLEIKDVSFGYDSTKLVLNNISFTVNEGDVCAILGSSGTGKSTLLRLIAQHLPKKSEFREGQILYDGLDTKYLCQDGRLGYMFQEPTLMDFLTVHQNIEMPLQILEKDKSIVSGLIDKIGLKDYVNYYPHKLSGGMMARVALARSFSTQPELLLLDEPFSALDIGWRHKLYNEFYQLTKENKTTTVLVTHNIEEALLIANNIIVLNKSGVIQGRFSMVKAPAIAERLSNIPDYIKTDFYSDLNVTLQQILILEDLRLNAQQEDLHMILKHIEDASGSESLEMSFDVNEINKLRKFSSLPEVHKVLTESFSSAKTNKFRHNLIWDILEYSELTIANHQQYLKSYLSNIEEYSELSRRWYKTESDQNYFEILKARIEKNDIKTSKKKWIYICDLWGVRKVSGLSDYLDNLYAKGKENNESLTVLAAQAIKNKISQ